MKTILVPTDYSKIALKAAQVGLRIATQVKSEKVIFYNAYQAPPVVTEAAVPVIPMIDIETLKDISSSGMKNFLSSLIVPADLAIENRTEFGMLPDEIDEICRKESVDLIVMGISGTSKIEEVLIGSTATSVVKHTKVPVIVVPADARDAPLKNIMLACDYENVAETIPFEKIKAFVGSANVSLQVVNVYEGQKDIEGDKRYQQELVSSNLTDISATFHSIQDSDFIHGINSFVQEHSVDLIITIPRKHGFFENLFKESHTKKLAFHTHVPTMFIKQENEH